MSDPQTLNRHSYVNNNPINFADPTGHLATDLCANVPASSRQQCLAAPGPVNITTKTTIKTTSTITPIPKILTITPPPPSSTYTPTQTVVTTTPKDTTTPSTLADKARQGDLSAWGQLLLPSLNGFRIQIEGSVGLGIVGLSGSAGVNIIHNRFSKELIGNLDWSVEPGLGGGLGVSMTGGSLIGWGSSDVDDGINGYSAIVSATAAGGYAASPAITVPIDKNGVLIHPVTGVIPFTLFFG